jgi:hypothetical protein
MKCQGAVLLTGAVRVQRYLYGPALSAKRLQVWEEWNLERAPARVRTAYPDVVVIFAPDESYGIEVANRLVPEDTGLRVSLLLVTDQPPQQTTPEPPPAVWDGCLVNPVKPSLLAAEIFLLITLARVDTAFARLARTRQQTQTLLEATDRSRRIREAAARNKLRSP